MPRTQAPVRSTSTKPGHERRTRAPAPARARAYAARSSPEHEQRQPASSRWTPVIACNEQVPPHRAASAASIDVHSRMNDCAFSGRCAGTEAANCFNALASYAFCNLKNRPKSDGMLAVYHANSRAFRYVRARAKRLCAKRQRSAPPSRCSSYNGAGFSSVMRPSLPARSSRSTSSDVFSRSTLPPLMRAPRLRPMFSISLTISSVSDGSSGTLSNA